MTITISQQAYWESFEEVVDEKMPYSHPDEPDVSWNYPGQWGQGYWRSILLREGLELAITHCQLHDNLILKLPERQHSLEYSFFISGQFKGESTSVESGQYMLCSAGIAPCERWEMLAIAPMLEVNVHIEPELFYSFVGDRAQTIPLTMQKLVGNLEQEYLIWSGATSSAMQMATQQILHCPYQGITKYMYLESKVWELMALLIEQVSEPQAEKSRSYSLKSDDIDRIHQAKNILLAHLDNPPSLIELARQVGLNDCTLKRGFRQVFGTTAFGYLHQYRLEQARQLLETEDMNIAKVAQRVGFADRSYFTTAFRKQFGCNPGAYRKTYRNKRSARSDIPFTPQKNSA